MKTAFQHQTYAKRGTYIFTRVMLSVGALYLSGCAIHPVQQDVTGLPTPVIVDRIRCETRLAIQDKSIELLRSYKEGNDERSKELADRLVAIRGRPTVVDPNREL